MKFSDSCNWLLDWLLANEPAITEELACRAEEAYCKYWGGTKSEYHHKRPKRRAGRAQFGAPPRIPDEVKRQAHAAALGDEPTDKIIERTGISRRTFYRLLKRGPPDPAQG